MQPSSPRPDYAAHVQAIRSAFPDVVVALREIIGPKLCAYLGSAKQIRAVDEWGEGVSEPSEEMQQRLRLALQVAAAIAERDGAQVAWAWFQGLNPELDDRSPARLLRAGNLDEVRPQIIAAERAFLVGG